VGIPQGARLAMSATLGIQNDHRGGHAAGYAVRRDDGGVHIGKTLGRWKEASNGFILASAGGDMALIHARYATCGKRTVDEAHPFAVKRAGKTRLWGMHNGVIYTANESAKRHKRPYSVDSLEVFQLLADGLTEEIAGLEGYGTLAWIRADDKEATRLVKLTSSAELFIVKVREGGYAYASTWEILGAALRAASLHAEVSYTPTVGQVLRMTREGVFATSEVVQLNEYRKPKASSLGDWRAFYSEHLVEPEEEDALNDLRDDLYDEGMAELSDEDLADIYGLTVSEVARERADHPGRYFAEVGAAGCMHCGRDKCAHPNDAAWHCVDCDDHFTHCLCFVNADAN
jgi:predicted glutamine amidotransferase